MSQPKQKKKNSGGRPTKITQEIIDKIAQVLQTCAYIETASAYVGISKDTFYAWLKQGARDKDAGKNNLYTRFSDAVEKAQATSEVKLNAIIDKAALTHWQAAGWKLERMWPKKYGTRDRMEHSGEVKIVVTRKQAITPPPAETVEDEGED